MKDNETRDYIGIVGVIVAFVGLFLPYMRALPSDLNMSLFETLNDNSHILVLVPILFLIFGALFSTDYRVLTRMTNSILLIALFAFTFTGERQSLAMKGVGFWVITIALLAAILSPFLWKVNEKIDGLFHGKRA